MHPHSRAPHIAFAILPPGRLREFAAGEDLRPSHKPGNRMHLYLSSSNSVSHASHGDGREGWTGRRRYRLAEFRVSRDMHPNWFADDRSDAQKLHTIF